MFYSSELMFWSRWRSVDSVAGILMTWLVYSIVTFIILWLKDYYHVNGFLGYMLLGAIFGWLIEGVIVQEMYAHFPFQVILRVCLGMD